MQKVTYYYTFAKTDYCIEFFHRTSVTPLFSVSKCRFEHAKEKFNSLSAKSLPGSIVIYNEST